MALTTAQILFYLAGAGLAADQMMTDPPENKMASTGQASGGGGNQQAQQFFSAGQPQPKAGAVPQAVQPAMDPNVTAATNALAQGGAPPPSAVGQSIVDGAIQKGLPLSVPNSPLMPGGPNTPPAMPEGIGGILGNINNVAGAMASLAPLLGLGPEQQRGISHAGAAGGQPGQSLFALPQRNTLAQILASLPRTYNG